MVIYLVVYPENNPKTSLLAIFDYEEAGTDSTHAELCNSEAHGCLWLQEDLKDPIMPVPTVALIVLSWKKNKSITDQVVHQKSINVLQETLCGEHQQVKL